jgi:hypothetical protein
MANTIIEKISTLVPSQLPEFIRDDSSYEKFIAFLEAYYEWTEQVNQITYESKKLKSYFDIDETIDGFVEYFINEFLPYFPQDSLADKRTVLKIAREIYTKKGTPASFKLLFRLLYDSDVEILTTGDLVLRASAGQWFQPKFLKITSDNDIFENEITLRGLRIFGETSKALASIEIVRPDYNDLGKYDVYISDFNKIFESGENIFVVDTNNVLMYSIDGEITTQNTSNSTIISGTILGEISSVVVDSRNQGSNYKIGDPVVFFGGGLEPNDEHASAIVSEISSGSINRVGVINGGYGYTRNNTTFTITSTSPPILSANIAVNNLNPEPNSVISFLVMDKISSNTTANDRVNITLDSTNYLFNFTNANANTTLSDAFTFDSFNGYPISAVIVNNGGVGYPSTPQIVADSSYYCNFDDFHTLRTLGILAPVLINSGGFGYQANDTIKFTGGSGTGAFANVANVDANGTITQIEYVYDPSNEILMPLGGLGYKETSLPTVEVVSSNISAYGASVYVPTILGSGSTFSVVSDSIGVVRNISPTSSGRDYKSTPDVTLRVQDIVVSNTTITLATNLRDFTLYQLSDINDANSITYTSKVSSLNLLVNDFDQLNDVFVLRAYNYNQLPNPNLLLFVDTGEGITNTNPTFSISTLYDSLGYINGVKTYGDGNARAFANFIQVIGTKEGYYISSDHQPSSYSVLQSEKFNDFSYEIAVEQPIFKYRDAVKGLLHPSGLNVLGKDLLRSNGVFGMSSNSNPLFYTEAQLYANSPSLNVEMQLVGNSSFTKEVLFNNLTQNLSSTFIDSEYIQIVVENGYDQNASPYIVYSGIDSVNNTTNTVTLTSGTFLRFANVALGYTDGGDFIIVDQSSLTNTPNYDIINNGKYSNANNHLVDIVFANDIITISGSSYSVINVSSNLIYVNTSTIAVGDSSNTVPFTINRTISTSNVNIFLPY